MSYKRKTDIQLVWEDNRDQLLSQLRRLTRRLTNELLAEAAERFEKAVAEGRVAEFELPLPAAARMMRVKAIEVSGEVIDAEPVKEKKA